MVVVDTTIMYNPLHVRKECLCRSILVTLDLLLDSLEVGWVDDVLKVVRKHAFDHGCME